MCVIVICEKRKITETELNKMWQANSHGAGMAWTEKGHVCYRKGFMKLEEFKQFYFGRNFSLPHVVHFRIASAGGVAPELTHPFTCAVDSPLADDYKGKAEALFHNGTYGQWREVLATTAMATGKQVLGAVNDSRLCAILRHLVPDMLTEISRTSSSRFAIINPSGKVFWFGSFTECQGIRCSNDYWKHRATYTGVTSAAVGPTRWDSESYPPSVMVDACGQQLTPEDLAEFQQYTLAETKRKAVAKKYYDKHLKREAKREGDKKAPLVGKKVVMLSDSANQRSLKWTPDRSDPRNYRSPMLHKENFIIVNGD